nr:DnaJ domain protein [Ipomoea batatas]
MGSKTRPVPESRALALLKSSEAFLDDQNFEECRKHALRAQESDPNHPGPGQLLAIADVISAFSATISGSAAGDGSSKKSDYYAILGVPRFTADRQIIKSHYEKLAPLLNPNENPYALSKQAYGLVTKAWRVLSDPDRKSEYDLELDIKLKSGNGSENRTFWTVCNYCYYLYEYPEEYEKCCMKCQNEKCGRAFNAAVCPPPPEEVIDKGEYDCLEVMSFEGIVFTNGDYGKAQRIDPNDGKFVGMKKQKMAAKSSKKLMGKGVRVKVWHTFLSSAVYS